jgi:hypothetical protein
MSRLWQAVLMENINLHYSEVIHKEHEEKLKKEIFDLRDKVGDFRLCNDYLDCKVFELEDTI